MPSVILAVFIEGPTPFLQDMLERVYKINYPKSQIHLWVHNAVSFFLVIPGKCVIYNNLFQVPSHEVLVSAWFSLISADYQASTYVSSNDNILEPGARRMAM